jgi:hypothetical protein
VDRRALENVLATDATKQAMTAFDSEPGLPDFSLYTKRGENVTNEHKNVPNGHKISLNSVKYFKWPLAIKHISTFSNPRPPIIYPNWDFWFENKSSGNPAMNCVTYVMR